MPVPHGIGDSLAIGETQFLGQTLHGVAMDRGRLVLGMQHEPELEARIGDGYLDSALSGLFQGLRQVFVHVGIENAPDLVEVSPLAFPWLASQVFFGATDKSVRCHPRIRKVEAHTGVTAHPQEEVRVPQA